MENDWIQLETQAAGEESVTSLEMSHKNGSQRFSLLDCEVTAELRTSMPHSTGAKEEGL